MKISILSLLFVVSYVAAEDENPYAHYPKVPKEAKINGFVDRVLHDSPMCAKECLSQEIKTFPCPKWDVGCFCVLPKHVKHYAKCVYDNCAGEDVKSASRVFVDKCAAVGVEDPHWMAGPAESSALESAAMKLVSPVSVSTSASSASAFPASVSSASASISSDSFSNTALAPTTSHAAADGGHSHAHNPKVYKEVKINGFVDEVLDDSPLCVKKCLSQEIDTSSCPKWDVACFCMLPKYARHYAKCIIDNCVGNDVYLATELFIGKCSNALEDPPYWGIEEEDLTALAVAGGMQDSPNTVSASASSSNAAPASGVQADASSSLDSVSVNPVSVACNSSAPAFSDYGRWASANNSSQSTTICFNSTSSSSAAKSSSSVASGYSASVLPSSVLADRSFSLRPVPEPLIGIYDDEDTLLSSSLFSGCLIAAAAV